MEGGIDAKKEREREDRVVVRKTVRCAYETGVGQEREGGWCLKDVKYIPKLEVDI
jgi:hypothetical protein